MMTGGEGGDSLWSEGSTRGGGSFTPHGGGEDRRSSLESRGDAVGDARSPERRGELRVRVFAWGSERRGLNPTGPGWLDLTHSGGSDQWAQVFNFFKK
jgi:hypothetical protein